MVGERAVVAVGRYRQERRLEGTDLDNPSSGQTPTSCPRGLILGGWEEVQETQRGGRMGLAQPWLQRMAVESKPMRCSHLVLGPHDSRDSAGAMKARSRGIGLP